MKRSLALALAFACAAVALAQPSAPPSPRPQRRPAATTLPIVVTVAWRDDAAVVERAWLDAQVGQASALFAASGLRFRIREVRRMPASHAELETRADRHALARFMRPRAINWFVVASLRDVDEPSRFRQGVHWRPRRRGAPGGAHFVIVSAIAGPTVLAHELGHFFGNPHSTVPGNLMSYDRGEGPPVLDAVQRQRIAARAREMLASGELGAEPPPRLAGQSGF